MKLLYSRTAFVIVMLVAMSIVPATIVWMWVIRDFGAARLKIAVGVTFILAFGLSCWRHWTRT